MQAFRTVLFSLLFILAACAGSALGDGKVFSQIAAAPTQIPDQSAIICWEPGENGGPGTQTLVIETSFEGEGTEFGWVVPLPGQPLVRPATAGTFPSLRGVFLPKIERPAPWAGFLFVLGLMFAAMLLKHPALRVGGILLVIVVGGFIFLMPALGKARSSTGGGPVVDVAVLSREIVGNYEVTVVSAPEPAALSAWLSDNGFAPLDAADPVIRDYVSKGWVFACTKLQRDEQTGLSAPHPLAFTFETAAPIYPMRLTGIGQTRPLELELFVFGSGTAKASGLAVASSGAVVREDAVRFNREIGRREIVITHPAIAELVPAAEWGTHLKGTIPPAAMNQDMAISFGPPREIGRAVLSAEGAWAFALNLGAAIFAVGFFVAVVALSVKLVNHPKAVQIGGLGIALAVFAGIATAALTPAVETASWRSGRAGFDGVFEIRDAVLDHTGRLTFAEVQSIAADLADEHGFRIWDGPDGVTLDRVDGKLHLCWIDRLGQRHIIHSEKLIDP